MFYYAVDQVTIVTIQHTTMQEECLHGKTGCHLLLSRSEGSSQATQKLAVTVLTQIKRMIQSSARNSILGIYGWIQLAQAATN